MDDPEPCASRQARVVWSTCEVTAETCVCRLRQSAVITMASNWSRPFDEPIQPPKGKKLVTLRDGAAYIMALPKSKHQSPEWQAATEALLMAAEGRGPIMHAHIGTMLALHGAKRYPNMILKRDDEYPLSKRTLDKSRYDGHRTDDAQMEV